jgi:hypothetical protein
VGFVLGIVRRRHSVSFGYLHAFGRHRGIERVLPDPDDLAVVQHPVLLQLLLELQRLEHSGSLRLHDVDSFGVVPAFGRHDLVRCLLLGHQAGLVASSDRLLGLRLQLQLRLVGLVLGVVRWWHPDPLGYLLPY